MFSENELNMQSSIGTRTKRLTKVAISIIAIVLFALAVAYTLNQSNQNLRLYTADLEVSKAEIINEERKYDSLSKISSNTWSGTYADGPQQVEIVLEDGTTFVLEYFGYDAKKTRRKIIIAELFNGGDISIIDESFIENGDDFQQNYEGVITVNRGEVNLTPYRIGWR